MTIVDDAFSYYKRGWIIHPLSSPKAVDKQTKELLKTAGKAVLIKNWQDKETVTQAEITLWFSNIDPYYHDCNIGLQCGRRSGVTVLDFDSELFKDYIFQGVALNTLVSGRINGRGHVYFKYNAALQAQKHHDLGIEVLTDGNNAVLPPSIHKSGDVYKWADPNAPLMEMPELVLQRLNKLFQTETELKQIITKCRHCFRDVIKRKPDMHGADGREYMLAVCTDLKANGAQESHITMFARLMYGAGYNESETLREWQNIDPAKTWSCEKLKERLPAYVDLILCEKCEVRRRKYKDKEGRTKTTIKAPLELPPIPHELIDSAPVTIDELLKVFKEHLYIEEDCSITIPLAEVVSNFAPIEPDIIGIIGASGSSKTELIRALGELENQYFYPVSSLTGHTFVSGLKENIDLAPALRGRLLTIKDFTSILSKKKDEVSEIFADMRELTDGHIGKDFGSGVKKHYKNIHSSILFGCTNAIEKHTSMYSNLGQRIVFFRPVSDKKKAMKQAMRNAGKEGAFREILHKVIMQFLSTILSGQKERMTTLSHIPDEMKERVEGLVTFLANVRTPIDRDFKGNMATLPEPEYPTRLAKTMCKLIDAHALLYNRAPTKQDEYVAYRLTLDNIPMERRKVLSVLLDGEEKTTSEVQQAAKIPNTMAHRVLDDLKALEIIEYYSGGIGKPDVWQLINEDYGEILEILFNLEKIFSVKTPAHSERPQGDIRYTDYTLSFLNEYHFFKLKRKRESPIDNTTNQDTPISEYHPGVNQDAAPQPQKQKSENCGICGKPLNGNAEKIGLGLGLIHPSCKFTLLKIEAIVDIPPFTAIDNITRSMKSGEIREVPIINALPLINRKAASRAGA